MASKISPTRWPNKDDGSVLDYFIDFTDEFAEIGDGDTVASVAATVTSTATTPPLVPDSTDFTTTRAIVWLSGGLVGSSYVLKMDVVTTLGRTYSVDVKIKVIG